MEDTTKHPDRLVVSLEGDEAYEGFVDARAYFLHINRLIEALGALERIYLDKQKRQTRYLIANQKRINPFIQELEPRAMTPGYSVVPAQSWSADQLFRLRNDEPLDDRINADVLDDLAKLPPAKNELVRNFRMNGSYKEVLFDQKFREAATRRAAEKRIEETAFFAGEVFGEVTGRLLKIDGLEGNYAVIVPDIGGDQIKVLFDEGIRKEIGPHYDHRVTAIGVLKYTEASPFPKSIRVQSGAISDRDPPEFRPSLLDLEGMFKGCYDDDLSEQRYFG